MFKELFKKTPKIRLVAIAKNESAYLVEWILHHVYFGFDSLEIYLNRCSDPSELLVKAFQQEPKVTFIDANAIFEQYNKNPQIAVYRQALRKAYKDGISQVLFLDIDEFWAPLDFRSSIYDELKGFPKFDSVSFEWCNKLNEEEFSQAVSRSTYIARARHVKSIVSVRSKLPSLMNPHNVRDPKMVHFLANKQLFICPNDKMAEVATIEIEKPIKASFILHRMYRSQKEFVASLGRLNPEQMVEKNRPLKSNRRSGYINKRPEELINFANDAFDQYQTYMSDQGEKYSAITIKGQQFVNEEFKRVLSIIENADISALPMILEALQGITLPEVKFALQTQKSHCKHSG